MPLRKLLLHGPCCYKPPVERSRSAPKLGSITEDLLGEQQEQELQEEEEEEHAEGCPEEEEDRAGEGEPAEPEAEAKRALVVAMHFECGDLLDTLESGHEEALGGGGVSPGLEAGSPLLLGSTSDMRAELSQLINDLGELSFGNDVRSLQADLRVTRLLSGESTGSESSIEGGGPDANTATAGDPSCPADCASPDEPHSG